MMDRKLFDKLFNIHQNFIKGWDKLYDSLIDVDGLDSIILRYADEAIYLAWSAYLTQEGVDWIDWYMNEKMDDSYKAYDADKNEIPTNTIDDMWNLIQPYIKK